MLNKCEVIFGVYAHTPSFQSLLSTMLERFFSLVKQTSYPGRRQRKVQISTPSIK
jgi:hypothetical protein